MKEAVQGLVCVECPVHHEKVRIPRNRQGEPVTGVMERARGLGAVGHKGVEQGGGNSEDGSVRNVRASDEVLLARLDL